MRKGIGKWFSRKIWPNYGTGFRTRQRIAIVLSGKILSMAFEELQIVFCTKAPKFENKALVIRAFTSSSSTVQDLSCHLFAARHRVNAYLIN